MTDAVLVDPQGIVIQINRGEASDSQRPSDSGEWMDAPNGVVVAGFVLVKGEFIPPKAGPPSIPPVISDRQFSQQLALMGRITWDEATAWASRGDLPAELTTALESIPAEDNQRDIARLLLSSARDFERSHPMTATLGALLGFDEADLDDMWRAAALL